MKHLILIAALLIQTAQASVTVTVNGSSHTIPQTNERGWGTNVTAWIQAMSLYTLQPSGGTFTLTAEVNTGATYGFKVPYIKTATSTPSTVGVLRLAVTDSVGWRNNANGANLLLAVNGSNQLTFDSAILANSTLSNVASTAVGASLNPGTDNTYVFGTASFRWLSSYITSVFTNRVQAIGVNDLTLATDTGHDLYIAPGSGGKILLQNGSQASSGQLFRSTDASGTGAWTVTPVLGLAGTSTGTLGLSGVTSGVVTIQPSASAGTYNFNLPTTVGIAGEVLTSQAGGSTAMTWSSVLTNPMTTLGDIIYENVTPQPTRLAGNITTSKKFLTQTGTGAASAVPGWNLIAATDMLSQGTMTVFSANGTFTTPSTSSAGTIYKYLVIGAGGGGGGANNASANAGGGGGGAIAMGTFTGVAASTGITITVSSTGGTAGSTGGSDGGTGGTSTIGSPVTVASTGGVGGTGSTGAGYKAGGAGGTTTGSPTLSVTGGAGYGGSNSTGGSGAHSMMGAGGQGGVAGAGGGVAPSGFGAGAGGAIGSTAAGAVGGPGLIIIWQVTP